MKTEIKNLAPQVQYIAKGFVLGSFWGGGRGSYPSKQLTGDSIDEIKKQATEGIKTGSLDSGMGYESLIGAVLEVVIKTTIEVEGKTFIHKDYTTIRVGKLTDEQFDFLFNQL